MQTASATTRLYTLNITSAKTWLLAAAFAAGNILLPQLVHTVPNGGHIFLPIFFFTLIAAYKYGWQTGALTATASPLINSALFGMPAAAMLPTIVGKGLILAVCAGFAAKKSQSVTLVAIAAAVVSAQILGMGLQTALAGADAAWHAAVTGMPGILIQIFGGYMVLKAMASRTISGEV